MKKDLIIFGLGKISEVITYFFEKNTDYNVVAYTVDSKYKTKKVFNKKPVVDFESISDNYSPNRYYIFVALGYQDLNNLRASKLKEVKEKGYKLVSYIDPNSSIPEDLIYGDNCFVMSNALIHPKVKIGNNVFVWSGAMIGHHTEIGDNCWLTSCTNIAGCVKVGRNCFFALNSTIANSLEIGNHCFFGANSIVTKCVSDNQVYIEQQTQKFRLNSSQFLRLSNHDTF